MSKPNSIGLIGNNTKDVSLEFIDNRLRVNYKGTLEGNIKVKIVNLSGQTIYFQKLNNDVFYIDLPDNKSMYIMSIFNGTNIFNYKILLN